MREIKDYTVEELVRLGAKVDVVLFTEDKEDAQTFVGCFGGLNKVEETLNNTDLGGYYEATESSKNLISVTAFYDK